jgi:glutathione S-transferase
MSSSIFATSRSLHLMGPAWTRAFRCLWMLEELGVPYELVDAQPASRRVKKFNTSGKVPVLLEFDRSSSSTGSNDNDEPSLVLTESVAINTYLGDCYDVHKLHLVPAAGTQDRAIYDATVCSILSELDAQSLWIHRKHEAMGQYFGYIPDAVTHATQQFQRMNAQVAQQVVTSGGPYLLGANFTAADILYVHCLDWASSIGWKKQWPEHLAKYRAKCHERAAYQKVKGMRDVGKEARKEGISKTEAASSASSSSSTSNDNRSKL